MIVVYQFIKGILKIKVILLFNTNMDMCDVVKVLCWITMIKVIKNIKMNTLFHNTLFPDTGGGSEIFHGD